MSKKAQKKYIHLAHGGRVYLDATVSARAYRQIRKFVGDKTELTDSEVEYVRELASQ